ncbi:RHS repeat-associated core domain-containing protein, partial [Chitinophaga sp. 22536]|uniref:RHS repeat-associated core domain-containing protein n=1 Tax=unclassified Chitinophaga TaxID=2619133 RepID=UPI003F833A7F
FYKSNGPVNKNSPVVPAENMVADLIAAFGGSAAADATHGSAAPVNSTPFNANFYNNDYRQLKEKNPDQQPGKPKAYLNYVLFDDQFKMVEENSGVKQVKAEPDQLQTLSQDKMVMKKSGFLYVYTSNESAQEVFFDNLLVAQASGPVLEETHYYPFGLTMAGISYSVLKGANYPENRTGYNGNELQSKEFSDRSGLELYDFNARTYDQQIGRFLQIDPWVEEGSQEMLTPYQFSYNNPIRYSDPDGKCPACLILGLPAVGEALGALGAAVGITVVVTKAIDKLKVADLGGINYTPGSPFGPYSPMQQSRLIEAKDGKTSNEGASTGTQDQSAGSTPQQNKPEDDEKTNRNTNKLEPNKDAGANHTTFLRDKDGNIYKYEEWKENPRNPNRFDTQKRFDGGTKDGTPGADHHGLPTPHMNQKKDPQGNKMPNKGARIPTGNEFPRNNRFLPWLKS